MSDPRIVLLAKLIHKGNEVIGRDLEFGIGTMTREHDGGTRERGREAMTMKEDVEIEVDRKKKRRRERKRKEDGATEEGGEGARCTWVQRC